MIKDGAVKANDFHRSQSEKRFNFESRLKSQKAFNLHRFPEPSPGTNYGPRESYKWSATYSEDDDKMCKILI